MPILRRLLAVCWVVAAVLSGMNVCRADEPSSAENAPEFKAGFAERDITPEIGMEQPGGYGKAFARSQHDPCKVRAAVFDDGKNRVALVGIDALLIRHPSVAAVRTEIEKRTGIPAQSILVSASHTHSGGPTGMILPGEFDADSELVRSLAYEKSTIANPSYLARVESQIVEAVCAADASRTPARCGAGFGVAEQAAFNRRFHMRNGLTMTHPGQGNPDIVEPAGPVDPQVGVIGAWDKNNQLVGCVVNFACHATTAPGAGGSISADYVYYLEKTIRGMYGDQAVVVFLPGAAGDVTQVDNRHPRQLRAIW